MHEIYDFSSHTLSIFYLTSLISLFYLLPPTLFISPVLLHAICCSPFNISPCLRLQSPYCIIVNLFFLLLYRFISLSLYYTLSLTLILSIYHSPYPTLFYFISDLLLFPPFLISFTLLPNILSLSYHTSSLFSVCVLLISLLTKHVFLA